MMAMEFPCPACGAVLRVGAEKLGQHGKCPKCGQSLVVPAEDQRSSSAEATASATSLRQATPEQMVAELTRRRQGALLTVFGTLPTQPLKLDALFAGQVRCYATQGMDTGDVRQVLTRMAQSGQTSDRLQIHAGSAPEASQLHSLKGDVLGMRLEDFKKKYHRKSTIGVTLPWCSDATPKQLHRELLSEAWHHRAGIVHARVDFPAEQNSPTIGSVKTNLLLYQFLDGRLFRITAFFDTDWLHMVREAIEGKYGPPTQEVKDPLELHWDNGITALQLIRGSIRPKKASLLHCVHHQWLKIMKKRSETMASDL
jgi:predicted Zn finger-like uncharacterized protein